MKELTGISEVQFIMNQSDDPIIIFLDDNGVTIGKCDCCEGDKNDSSNIFFTNSKFVNALNGFLTIAKYLGIVPADQGPIPFVDPAPEPDPDPVAKKK